MVGLDQIGPIDIININHDQEDDSDDDDDVVPDESSDDENDNDQGATGECFDTQLPTQHSVRFLMLKLIN